MFLSVLVLFLARSLFVRFHCLVRRSPTFFSLGLQTTLVACFQARKAQSDLQKLPEVPCRIFLSAYSVELVDILNFPDRNYAYWAQKQNYKWPAVDMLLPWWW